MNPLVYLVVNGEDNSDGVEQGVGVPEIRKAEERFTDTFAQGNKRAVGIW